MSLALFSKLISPLQKLFVTQDGKQLGGATAKQAAAIVLELQAACSAHVPSYDIRSVFHLGSQSMQAACNSKYTVLTTADKSDNALLSVCLRSTVCKRLSQVLGRIHEPGDWCSNTGVRCCVCSVATRCGSTPVQHKNFLLSSRLCHVFLVVGTCCLNAILHTAVDSCAASCRSGRTQSEFASICR
jgi:hypothetical protein